MGLSKAILRRCTFDGRTARLRENGRERSTETLESATRTERRSVRPSVLERRAGVRLAQQDCFAATVGGVRLLEPATDLAVALAIASSAADLALPTGVVAIGEVGLAGDVRPVTSLGRRLGEAGRLGFTDAIVPSRSRTSGAPPQGMRLHEVGSLHEAITVARRLIRDSAAAPSTLPT